MPSAKPPPFCPLEFCLFSIAYRSACFASFVFAVGDAEKTVLKYPFAAAGAAPAAVEGGDFFLESIHVGGLGFLALEERRGEER